MYALLLFSTFNQALIMCRCAQLTLQLTIRCPLLLQHFSDIIEDQFDFNTYCLRRMTIRSYVGLLR